MARKRLLCNLLLILIFCLDLVDREADCLLFSFRFIYYFRKKTSFRHFLAEEYAFSPNNFYFSKTS